MIYEYALDPALLDNWKDCRFFQQSFGPDKGRLIADYPRKWKRAVLEAIRKSGCGDVEKKRIKEALKHLSAPTTIFSFCTSVGRSTDLVRKYG